ncbi:MAG: hypothetical protein GY759_15370, partial [Chloroflexi bacterium]|nr:hypothetical protein [Chloroflexota bacterium]
MNDSEIQAWIGGYLAVVNGESASITDPEAALIPCLDRLAIAANRPIPDDCGSTVDAPELDYQSLYAEVGSRFKKCGLYQAGSLVLGDDLVGDAIDDICDIAIDLSGVKWLFENIGDTEALWMFHWGWHFHWGAHLRSLQWYLLESERTGQQADADRRQLGR